MIPKPGKDKTQVASYRPISLLSVLSKVFEKLLLSKLGSALAINKVVPNHQFGFRHQHSTIEQEHRVVNVIKRALEEKKYCSAVFLDVSQAFDKVWHDGLLYKIKKLVPVEYHTILKNYLDERKFFVKQNSETSDLYLIKAGVPQGSVLGPVLYTIFTSDLPTSTDVTIATFADDTAILSSHVNPNTASRELQDHLFKIQEWLKLWRIKVNETKSVQVTFTNKKQKHCPSVKLNEVKLPQKSEVKYLGMHLDRKLTWKKHIETKRTQLKLKLSQMYWLIGRQSKLSLNCKVLIYKAIIKPIWTYGIQLWGSASASNIELLQRFQSKALRCLANAPWYVTNQVIHRDLKVE
jgi:hypothetical protein